MLKVSDERFFGVLCSHCSQLFCSIVYEREGWRRAQDASVSERAEKRFDRKSGGKRVSLYRIIETKLISHERHLQNQAEGTKQQHRKKINTHTHTSSQPTAA